MRIASSQFQASMNRSLQINQGVIAKLTEQMPQPAKRCWPARRGLSS